MKAFLCHSKVDSDFVLEVAKNLRRCLDEVFCYEEETRVDEEFEKRIKRGLHECDVVAVFCGAELTPWQEKEIDWAWENRESFKKPGFYPCLLQRDDFPANLREEIRHFSCGESVKDRSPREAVRVAADIARGLEVPFFVDGLPLNPHLFDYEKDIIEHFRKANILRACSFDNEAAKESGLTDKDIQKNREKRLDGCPSGWPSVVCWKDDRQYLAEILGEQKIAAWQEQFGYFRPEHAAVVAAALSRYHHSVESTCNQNATCLYAQGLAFPEAGPREFFLFPRRQNILKVAVVVSGKTAPGINAVIDGIVQRHHQYANMLNYHIDVVGFVNGFRGLINLGTSQVQLHPIYTSARANQGGSILGTSHMNELLDVGERRKCLESIIMKLFAFDIDILYVIGGDGSMKAAHAIWTVAQEHAAKSIGRQLSVVGIPKTMDNDILWVWQAFGFASALEEAGRAIEDVAREIQSNPALCVMQLYGSDSGFVATHAVHACVTHECDVVLIPEIDFSIEALAEYLRGVMVRREDPIPRGLVVMAETAIPIDAMDFLDEKSGRFVDSLSPNERQAIQTFHARRLRGERTQGETTDDLRSAGLKVVSQGLKKLLIEMADREGMRRPQPTWRNLRVFTNEPRHLLRAIRPSSTDIIMANRLGTLAVDNAIAGYTDFMVSQWLTEYVLVPLQLVVLGKKRIPKSGIFWRSTLAKTGQPADLV